jgi:hypothetical protein
MAREHMFAVRLSAEEWSALEEFLELASSEILDESLSAKFRYMILELEGRLYRNFVNHLRLRAGQFEGNVKDLYYSQRSEPKEERREVESVFKRLS